MQETKNLSQLFRDISKLFFVLVTVIVTVIGDCLHKQYCNKDFYHVCKINSLLLKLIWSSWKQWVFQFVGTESDLLLRLKQPCQFQKFLYPSLPLKPTKTGPLQALMCTYFMYSTLLIPQGRFKLEI